MAGIVTLSVLLWHILGFVAPLPFAYPGEYNYAYGEPQIQDYQSFSLPQQKYGQQSQYASAASLSAIGNTGNTYDNGYPNLQLPNQAQNAAFLKAPQSQSYQNELVPTTTSQQQVQMEVAAKIGKQQLIQELTNQIAAKRTLSANQPVSGVAESYHNNQVQSDNRPAPQSPTAVTEAEVQTGSAQENVNNPFAQLYQQVIQRPEQTIDSEFLKSWKQRLPLPDAQKPYLVIYPDGRTENVDKIEDIKVKYPNFRLLNIGQSPTTNPAQAPVSHVQQSNIQPVPPQSQMLNLPIIKPSQSQLSPRQIVQQEASQNAPQIQLNLPQANSQTKPDNLQSNIQTKIQSQSIASQALNSNVQPAQRSESVAQQVLIPNGQTVPQNQPQAVIQPFNSGPQNPLSSLLLNSTSTKPVQESNTVQQKVQLSKVRTVPQTKPQPVEQSSDSGPQNPLASTLLNSSSTQRKPKPDNVAQQSPQPLLQPKPQPIDQPSNQGSQNPLASVLLNSTRQQSVPESKQALFLNEEKVSQSQPQTFDQASYPSPRNPLEKHAQKTTIPSGAASTNDNLSNSKVNSNKNANSENESLNNQKKSSNSAEVGSSEISSLNKISTQSESTQQDANQNPKYQASNKIDSTSTQDNETTSQSSSNEWQKSRHDSSQKTIQTNEKENQSKLDSSEQNLHHSQTDDADKQAKFKSTDQHQSQLDNHTDDIAKQPNPRTSKSTKGSKSKHLNNPDDTTLKKSNTAITSSNNPGDKTTLENSLTENTSDTESVSSKQSGKVIVFDTTGLQSGVTDSEILSNLIGDSPYSIIQFFLVKPERTIERNITRQVIDDEHYIEEIIQSETYGDAEPVISCESYLVDAPQKE